MIDLTQLLQALIALATACITAFIIPYIKEKTTTEQQKKILTFVKVAVGSAEQIFTKEETEEKKNYVIQYMLNRGIKISEDRLNAAIEEAVLNLHSVEKS